MGMMGHRLIIICWGCLRVLLLDSCAQEGHLRMEHVGTRGLVCSLNGLEILPDVCEGLLGVCKIPFGSVLVVRVVVVFAALHLLKVHVVVI